MSTDRVTLEVSTRGADQLGSRNVRRLRSKGLIPGVLYGKQSGSFAFVVGERHLRAALSGSSGVHTVVDVVLEGNTRSAVVKDFQRHPVRGTLTHIDFHEVRLDVAIQATVHLVLIGESPGARQGGVVQPVAREVRIEALPTAIPEHIEVSVDTLELGGTLRLAEAIVPAGVTILDDLETPVASCAAPRAMDEVEGELVDGEADADSADADADESSPEE
jgi:large subunit ribosomal protein L25